VDTWEAPLRTPNRELLQRREELMRKMAEIEHDCRLSSKRKIRVYAEAHKQVMKIDCALKQRGGHCR
jgi:hypothetical protein